MVGAEASALVALFGDEEDIDLAALHAVAAQPDSGALTDAEIEALLREQWGLPTIDVEGALRAATAGQVSVRPDDDERDDYTDEEWTVVTTLRKLCLDAISASTPRKRLAKAVEFCFVRGTEEPRYGVSFHLACEMLKARPWVVQALIQHFWFLRGIEPGPLPFMADPLPEALHSEAILHGWEAGLRIAAAAWMHPGVLETDLRQQVRVGDDDYERSLGALCNAGIVSLRMGRAYLTSRPASFRRARQTVSWSRSFIGD